MASWFFRRKPCIEHPALRRAAVRGRLCRWLAGIEAACVLPVALAAPTGTNWIWWDTGLSASAETLDSRWTSVVQRPAAQGNYALAPAGLGMAWGAPGPVTGFIDVSPAHVAASVPQATVRPQFALGSSSDALRTFLRGAGFDATHCFGPMMKMHSSFAGSSSHANVSLSARCSLH